MQSLRKIALALPDVEEGIACKGTAIECATFKVRNKAFLFVGATEARVKLQQSLAEAAKLAAKEPDHFQVGANGWVKVTFSKGDALPLDLLGRWIVESYRLLAPKQRAAKVPGHGVPTAARKKSATKKTSRK